MVLDQFGGDVDALLRWNVRKPNQPGVRNTMQMNELSEVGIDGDENPTFGSGLLQQGPITRVWTEFSSLDHVVSLAAEPIGQPASGAPVYQEFHRPFTDTAASVSPAMTACA